MKYTEILGGIQTWVNNEENELVEAVQKHGRLRHKDLDERQLEHCNNLVKRGILMRQNDQDGHYFKEVNDDL
jgi:hypothetical protein